MIGQHERRLAFALVPRAAREAETSDTEPFTMRARRLRPDLAFRGEEDPSPASDEWTHAAAQELLRRLRAEGWPHADIIEAAAANGGFISRAEVYALAGYPEHRMLRGFTRPTRRITRDLIREGQLAPDAEWPLLTRYSQGVLATHFIVPDEFTRFFG